MNPKRLHIEKSLPAGVLIGLLTLGFCIFTDNQGIFRKYADADIPFVYRVHESALPEWLAGIKAGADAWTNEPSNYFEFEEGLPTTVTGVAQDGVNLVFFDTEGVNFSPGTNVIAFSSTFTTNVPGFRSVESDLVWNARDFPPGTSGEPDRQDLQAVIAHEFGHHMGIAHTGPVGGPPGCGPLLPAATMFGTSANGDTTGRSLEADDKASAAALYPAWMLTGLILDAETTQPLPGAGIITDENAAGSFTGPHASVPGSNNRSQRPGIVGLIPAEEDGTYTAFFLKDRSALTIEFFGYQTAIDQVQFSPPGGIGHTEVIQKNFFLQKSPVATLSGAVIDSLTREPVAAEIEVFATGTRVGTPDTALARLNTVTGEYAVDLPVAEDYLIIVHPEIPYPTVSFAVENFGDGNTGRDIELNPAKVFIVNDDTAAGNQRYLEESLDILGISYFTWQTSEDSVPRPEAYSLFPEPRTVFWLTGPETEAPLSEAEQQSLAGFLDSGGHLVLSGPNIAESDTGSVLLADYLQVGFSGNFAPPILRGVAGDPVGNGLIIRTSGGPGNSTSKDVLTPGPDAIPAIGYGPTGASGAAGVRITNAKTGWRAVFLGFGIETIENTGGVRDLLVDNILRWFNVLTGIEGGDKISDQIPAKFELAQNFPNPFNPATSIRFALPQSSKLTLTIFNSRGQQVRRLTDQAYPAGTYKITWDGRDQANNRVSSGIYFYRLQTSGGFRAVRKMMLIK